MTDLEQAAVDYVEGRHLCLAAWDDGDNDTFNMLSADNHIAYLKLETLVDAQGQEDYDGN